MNDSKSDKTDTYPRPLVSIVMPVHNQQLVLRQTLESVCAQSLHNFELVLVDDGSIDGSLAIEREFARRDSRIRLFPCTAKGAAPARNFGLDAVTGRYVIFLDSDDLFHPDLLLDMASVLEATGADICICEADFFFGDEGATRPFYRFDSLKEGLYRRHALEYATFQVGGGAAWNKMYRRRFLIDTRAFFQDAKCYNDSFFVVKAMSEADSVYLLKRSLVLYRRGLGTSIQDRRRAHPYEAIKVSETIINEVYDKGAFTDSELASLGLACTSILVAAVGDLITVNAYDERAHESIVAIFQRLGMTGTPPRPAEIGTILKAALVQRATYQQVVWAHARWVQETRAHTLMEKLDFALRIVIAIVLSNLPVGGKPLGSCARNT